MEKHKQPEAPVFDDELRARIAAIERALERHGIEVEKVVRVEEVIQ